MEYSAPPTPPDDSNIPALILSAVVHIALVAALFFGVQWKQAPTAVSVEVWRGSPPAAARPEPAPETPKPPPPETKPEPPPETKPVTKVEPAPQIKPDIAIKEEKKKKEEPKKPEPKKEEPKKEEPKKPEAKKEEPKKPEPKKEEPKKPEPKKPETEARPDFSKQLDNELKQSQQQTQQAAQRQKAADDMRARAEAEAGMRAQAGAEHAAAGRGRALADYQDKLRAAIRSNIVLPAGVKGNPEAVFIVSQLPNGEVLPPVKVITSSGNKQLDEAIVRAILKASPLPKPADASVFDRELKIPYHPYEEPQ